MAVASMWKRLQRTKFLQCIAFLVLTLVCYMMFKTFFASPGLTHTLNQISDVKFHLKPANLSNSVLSVHSKGGNSVTTKPEYVAVEENDDGIHVLILFVNADERLELQRSFKRLIASIFRFATRKICFHIVGDKVSVGIATRIAAELSGKHKVIHHDIDAIAASITGIIKEMQKYFSYKPGAYYSNALFFISIAIHRYREMYNLQRLILLDADLQFHADINQLYQTFENFSDSNMIGLAREQQPVYRHLFSQYRSINKQTLVGDPPPNGLTGFNSGVVLLDLNKMRKSKLYNSLLTSESLRNLTGKYMFKGHLGDQDFFSLVSMEFTQLFYVLPCTWNRQLCQWWRDHGYKDVADSYHKCEGQINVYHGNCNSRFPNGTSSK